MLLCLAKGTLRAAMARARVSTLFGINRGTSWWTRCAEFSLAFPSYHINTLKSIATFRAPSFSFYFPEIYRGFTITILKPRFIYLFRTKHALRAT